MTHTSRTALVVGAVGVLAAAGAVTLVLALRGPGGSPADASATGPSASTSTGPSEPTDPAAPETAPGTAPGSAAPTAAPAPAPAPEPSAPATSAPGRPGGGPDGRRTVDVVLGFAEWSTATRAIEASAYAQVYEEDGTCTLTATGGGATATTEQPALADVTTTSCGVMSVPAAQLRSGTWQVRVEYASATSTGASATVDVEVP
ncbi:hypothetical protein [Cellulomonas telluris]|uniref:hypothetical protein n=1 Tax=Cellulomonas telluris TaxID=2306636 RepID=UPI0010A85096|nr:hypothetical protein [Cellulomonas telluris]